MDKELNLLDKLTNKNINNETINENSFINIDWEKLFSYSLKSKTVCIIFDTLQSIKCLEIIPTKIYKLMSEIFIGNVEHNRIINKETKRITVALTQKGINLFQYKNLSKIATGSEDFLMPNDIDFIAFSKDKYLINQYFNESNYKIKRINNELEVYDISTEINSVLYEEAETAKYKYPIKVDINYSFNTFDKLDILLKEYLDSICIEEKDDILFIISVIDFFDHINGDIHNIKIDDFLKIKRLNIQYNELDELSMLHINELVQKYNLKNIFVPIEKVLLNYPLAFQT